MVQVDLITGFLGAGKTTFLRRYAAWWAGQGVKVCVLENDFGAVNVDAMLLQDLEARGVEMETISGGCDCDTHQRRMRTKLISMAMRGFERVIVEPSGIFDVDANTSAASALRPRPSCALACSPPIPLPSARWKRALRPTAPCSACGWSRPSRTAWRCCWTGG